MPVDAAEGVTGTAAARPARVRRPSRRLLVLLGLLVVLLGGVVVSIAVGSANLPLSVVIEALLHNDGSVSHVTVSEARVSRTLLALAVGAALGVAGALIQALTRNPLADPGILGVNAGAGFAVVLAVAVLGITRIEQYLPFAFLGAVGATLLVYGIASQGRAAPSPIRLTLVGVALGAVLAGMAQTLTLLESQTFDRMRFWGVGSLVDRPEGTLEAVLPAILVGLVIAAFCARALNAVALGEDLARAMGVRVSLLRGGVVVAVTLLCGAATAAVGPIGFVGLMVPHAVRWLVGPDQRWILAFTVVAAPLLTVTADVVGRLVVHPAELQVGIVTAFIGAPILVLLVRATRASGL